MVTFWDFGSDWSLLKYLCIFSTQVQKFWRFVFLLGFLMIYSKKGPFVVLRHGRKWTSNHKKKLRLLRTSTTRAYARALSQRCNFCASKRALCMTLSVLTAQGSYRSDYSGVALQSCLRAHLSLSATELAYPYTRFDLSRIFEKETSQGLSRLAIRALPWRKTITIS